MVACSRSLVAKAGLEILRKGINASSLPYATTYRCRESTLFGLGGYAICHAHALCEDTCDLTSHRHRRWIIPVLNAKTKNVTGLNGSGRSPGKLHMDYVRQPVPASPGETQIRSQFQVYSILQCLEVATLSAMQRCGALIGYCRAFQNPRNHGCFSTYNSSGFAPSTL